MDRVADELRRFGARGPVVFAVSGGADSVALLRAGAAVSADLGIAPMVAHLDHGLRPESADDAAWVAELAASIGAAFVGGRDDVASSAALAGCGIEEAARNARYGFLKRAAEARGASFVAVAHSADDQTETVLFQLLRGSGLRGLRGMPPRRRLSDRVTLIRPLLAIGRAEIESYLRTIGQPWLVDSTNADRSIARNRLRHDLLPLLREAINPRLDDSLRRLARQSDEVAALVTRAARRRLKAAAIETSDSQIRLRCDTLRHCPRPLIRETVALAWRRAGWPRQAMGFDHWDALADLVLNGGRRTLPGATDARRRRGELILRRGRA